MTVGEKIKIMREQIGMSQDELAKKMGYKDRSSISKIEKDTDKNITLDLVQRIAECLNCSPLYLMGWDNDSEETDESKTPEEINREKKFVNLYSKLTENEKNLVDNMLSTLSSRQ